MSQIDFIIAMSVVIGVIAFSISYVSSDMSTQFEQMNVLELKQAAKYIENTIETENIKIVHASFEDISGTDHTENIVIDLLGVSDVRIYRNGNLITSGDNSLSFPITLTANEVSYYDIFYSGSASSITVSGNNGIDAILLHEQDYTVVPDECTIDYDLMREKIGHNFKISYGSCEVGLEPPKGTVVARSVPVRLKSTLSYETANILVW